MWLYTSWNNECALFHSMIIPILVWLTSNWKFSPINYLSGLSLIELRYEKIICSIQAEWNFLSEMGWTLKNFLLKLYYFFINLLGKVNCYTLIENYFNQFPEPVFYRCGGYRFTPQNSEYLISFVQDFQCGPFNANKYNLTGESENN